MKKFFIFVCLLISVFLTLSITGAVAKLYKEQQSQVEAENFNYIDEQLKNIKPYDANGRVNGNEWIKALNMIDKKVSINNNNKIGNWKKLFEEVLGHGLVVSSDLYQDGGSIEWKLKNGTRIYYDKGMTSNEYGWLTVTHPDGTVEKFKPNGKK